MILFLAVGLPIKYLLTIPYDFGLTDYTLPGSIYVLSNLVLLGLMLLSYLSVSGKLCFRIGFILLFITEFSIALLQLNKSAVILVLTMAILGRFLAHRRINTLKLGAIFVVLFYLVITPIVGTSRIEIFDMFRATLGERIDVMQAIDFPGY